MTRSTTPPPNHEPVPPAPQAPPAPRVPDPPRPPPASEELRQQVERMEDAMIQRWVEDWAKEL